MIEETDQQRLARNLSELLQELRVAQNGVQVLFGFELKRPTICVVAPGVEEMMTGFRQLGYTGWNDDGVTTPDWYIPLTHDLYDADIRERLMHRITGRPN